MTNIDKIADLLEKLARETSIIICDPKYGFLYDEVHTLRLKFFEANKINSKEDVNSLSQDEDEEFEEYNEDEETEDEQYERHQDEEAEAQQEMNDIARSGF